jgi:hypothetical protein
MTGHWSLSAVYCLPDVREGRGLFRISGGCHVCVRGRTSPAHTAAARATGKLCEFFLSLFTVMRDCVETAWESGQLLGGVWGGGIQTKPALNLIPIKGREALLKIVSTVTVKI